MVWMSRMVWYPGIGFRKGMALSQVEKTWSEKAALLLLPYRNRDVEGSISIGGERADDLRMRITEALVEAFNAGYAEGGHDMVQSDRAD